MLRCKTNQAAGVYHRGRPLQVWNFGCRVWLLKKDLQGSDMPSAAYYLTMAAECRELSDRAREQHAAETLRNRAREYTEMARALDPKMVDRQGVPTRTNS
jgi:hypothetical protein